MRVPGVVFAGFGEAAEEREHATLRNGKVKWAFIVLRCSAQDLGTYQKQVNFLFSVGDI